MPAAVDEEGRRARDVASVGGIDVLCHSAFVLAFAQRLAELFDVKLQLLCVADQGIDRQRLLVRQQQVVHLPKFLLRGGGLRCLGGQLGMAVDVVQREVTPHVAQVAEIGE